MTTPSPNPTPRRIPVTVLTGFLGSGKTTVLNALVRSEALSRFAVIINELGEIGIDHHLVERSDESFTLVRNGCICCTVRDDLITTLKDLSARRRSKSLPEIDGVVLETTGLADPAPIIHTLMNDPTLLADYGLGCVVTTIDAANGEATLDSHPEALKQASVADLILLTKTDIADARAASTLRDRLARMNPSARLIPVCSGEIDAATFFSAGHFALDRKAEAVLGWLNAEAHNGAGLSGSDTTAHHHDHEHHHAHDLSRHDAGITSYCITRDHPLSWSGLQAWLDAVSAMRGNDLLRVKGIVNVAEHPDEPLVIHGVQHIFHPPVKLPRWPSADRRTRIVFITRNIDKETIDETLRVFEHRAARHRKPS